MAETQVEVQLINDVGIVPVPDDLIAAGKGAERLDAVKLVSVGDFKRGTLLMSGAGAGEFVAATAAGITSAKELCILCDDITIAAEQYAEVYCYFTGDFIGARVILPYETESDDHDTLIDDIYTTLRNHGIYIHKLHEKEGIA